MKTTTSKTTASLLALTAACTILGAPAFGQDIERMNQLTKEEHRRMMPRHEMMREMQKAQDEEIDKLAGKMNSAHGDERIDAIVAVLNKLIEQRKEMHDKMAAMMTR